MVKGWYSAQSNSDKWQLNMEGAMIRAIIACIALMLAACSQTATEPPKTTHFVGQLLRPMAPMYLISGTGSQRICRLWGEGTEVRVVFQLGGPTGYISAEVIGVGQAFDPPVSSSITIRQSAGIRECVTGDIVLVTPVDQSGFTTRSA